MYIIICPEDKLVLKRIIKVSGRINWENNSTKGKNSIRPKGDPYGSKWAKNSLNCLTNTQTIIGTQNKSLMVNVTL